MCRPEKLVFGGGVSENQLELENDSGEDAEQDLYGHTGRIVSEILRDCPGCNSQESGRVGGAC